jgi:YD repeat-containing protein
MNGDGFPDIVGPGYIKYTDPRGGFFDSGSGMSVVNQDTSFAVSGGLNASPIDIKSNSKGNVHTSQATAPVSGNGATQTSSSSAQSGGDAAESQYGFNVGGSVGISATFTNPASTDPKLSDALNKTPVDQTAPFELTFVDVNGDGLPDRVRQTPQGVFVQFNLGYGFSNEITWSGGGFENNESYAGSFGPSLGFTTPTRDFSAGLGLSESLNIPRYQWIDVNGDGILDRLHKSDTGDQVTVAFGTNSGLLPDVPYGTMASGSFQLPGSAIPIGQQIAATDTQGLGAGADFTIGIGPLCLVACWLIVNPGAHFDHSVSSNQIALIDVDGDGLPDVLKSTSDSQLTVSLNNARRTNLLKSVNNPLGGTINLEYKRDGNTTDQPSSVWTLSKVQVNDGRPGDGADVKTSTYAYSGGRYNKLEREMLGYSSVIEHQLATDGSVLRTIEQTYLNDNVFDSGLLTTQVLKDGKGNKLQEADTSWKLIDLKTHTDADLSLGGTDPAGVRLLNLAVGAEQTRTDQKWFDSSGGVGEQTFSTFGYDGLGNVVNQLDAGQTETSADDVTATVTYTSCQSAFNPDDYTRVLPACPAPQLSGGVPPYWTANLCPTWTSLPADLVITNSHGDVLRHRNGAPALCDNSSVTVQHDFFGSGANDFAESLLSYDAWGNYNQIQYPTDASGVQRRVDYIYDDYGHGNIATVTESRCTTPGQLCDAGSGDPNALTAVATFDGRTGRIATRTDANGQVTSYTYDPFGRIASVTGPYEQGTANKTATFEYHADNSSYAYAVAHNLDVKHPGNTIDTATFVDGIGRETQTKQDATLYTGVTTSATDVMIVSPAIDVDALGRATTVRYPVTEPTGSIGTYNTDKSGQATTIKYDLLDRQTEIDAPGSLTTTFQYDFANYSASLAGGINGKVFKNTVIAPPSAANPSGKPETSWVDVRGNVLAIDEGTPALHTEYVYDQLGQVLEV